MNDPKLHDRAFIQDEQGQISEPVAKRANAEDG